MLLLFFFLPKNEIPQYIISYFIFIMKKIIAQLRKCQSGQTLTEYALIIAVLAVAIVGTMEILGTSITNVFTETTNTLNDSI